MLTPNYEAPTGMRSGLTLPEAVYEDHRPYRGGEWTPSLDARVEVTPRRTRPYALTVGCTTVYATDDQVRNLIRLLDAARRLR